MEREKLESLLIDYIDGQLSGEARSEVEKMIASDTEVAQLHSQLKEVMGMMDHVKESEPSRSLKVKFEEALQNEMNNAKGKLSYASPSRSALAEQGKASESKLPYAKASESKQVFFQPWLLRAAAGIGFLIVGVAIGYWINESNQQKAEMAALKKEVEDNKRVMMAMLDNQQSASQRLMGATVAYELKQADDDIVKALVKTMNDDSNTNVRLSALDALSKFYKQAHVRNALVNSLATQKDPMVQIALIRLLVEMKEKEVVNELEQITRDGNVIKAVKDEAHAGILKLS